MMPPQEKISQQLNYLARHTEVRWEHVPHSMARFNLSFQICGQDISWQVLSLPWGIVSAPIVENGYQSVETLKSLAGRAMWIMSRNASSWCCEWLPLQMYWHPAWAIVPSKRFFSARDWDFFLWTQQSKWTWLHLPTPARHQIWALASISNPTILTLQQSQTAKDPSSCRRKPECLVLERADTDCRIFRYFVPGCRASCMNWYSLLLQLSPCFKGYHIAQILLGTQCHAQTTYSNESNISLQVEYQFIGSEWVPDFVHLDDFNPFLPDPDQRSLAPSLLNWTMEDKQGLHNLLKSLLKR